jgi:hypothetical protein
VVRSAVCGLRQVGNKVGNKVGDEQVEFIAEWEERGGYRIGSDG